MLYLKLPFSQILKGGGGERHDMLLLTAFSKTITC